MTLLNSLRRLSDPVARLRIAVKKDLKPQASNIIRSLAKNCEMHFWCDTEHGPNILFDTSEHGGRVLIKFVRPGANTPFLVADLTGMIAHFGWKEGRVRDFIRPALERYVKTRDPMPEYWRALEAMTSLTRRYLKTEDELAKAVERWVLLSQFRDGRIFELRRSALPVPQERPFSGGSDTEARGELDPIIYRMLDVGMTMEETREEFLKWIADKAPRRCRYQFMLAVAYGKCFKNDRESSRRRNELLRQYFLPSIMAEGDVFQAACEFVAFNCYGDEVWQRGDENFFHSRMRETLSRGEAGAVFQWLLTYGYATGFYPADVLEWGRKASEHNGRVEAWEMMRIMAPEAVKLAIKADRFGVAAALAQHFPNAAKPEKVRQFVQWALDLEQPIALSWESSIVKAEDK